MDYYSWWYLECLLHHVRKMSHLINTTHGFERTEPERKSIVICLFTCGWCSPSRSHCHSAPRNHSSWPRRPRDLCHCFVSRLQFNRGRGFIDFLKVKARRREKKEEKERESCLCRPSKHPRHFKSLSVVSNNRSWSRLILFTLVVKGVDEGGGRGGRKEEGLVIISLNLVYYFVSALSKFSLFQVLLTARFPGRRGRLGHFDVSLKSSRRT